MTSPFPGMDPYLERSWGDVHARLVTLSSTALNKLLPQDLIARVEERVAIESNFGDGPPVRGSVIPDARVFELAGPGTAASSGQVGVALAPIQLQLLDEAPTERFVEIIDAQNTERLVTVLEFVSRSNNKRDGIEAFIEKRESMVSAGVNFVEIDLVREGNWRRLFSRYRIPGGAVSAYRAAIHVPGKVPAAFLHPISVRESLPSIKIPLRPDDRPCDLALQPLVDDIYESGRYGLTINYRRDCDPPLEDADAAWAGELLAAAGKR